MFHFSNCSVESKYCNDSNAFVAAQVRDQMVDISVEELLGLKSKMYFILVSNSSECKKAKNVNKNVIAIISQKKYKDAFLN